METPKQTLEKLVEQVEELSRRLIELQVRMDRQGERLHDMRKNSGDLVDTVLDMEARWNSTEQAQNRSISHLLKAKNVFRYAHNSVALKTLPWKEHKPGWSRRRAQAKATWAKRRP